MQIFFIILLKLLPLYVIIFLGYIGGKYLSIKRETISTLLLDIIVPVVLFSGVVNTPLSVSTLSLPVLFFFICTFISLLVFYFSGLIWKDSTKNILAFISGSANTGYFGLGSHTAKEALIKVLKLLIFYALIIGILVNIGGIHLGKIFSDAASNFNGTHIVLGMMLIGIGLADVIKEKEFDGIFVGVALLAKYVL